MDEAYPKLMIRGAIGPAHTADPEHKLYYTADGIRLTDDAADKNKLAWVGYGDDGKLMEVLKSEIRLEQPDDSL